MLKEQSPFRWALLILFFVGLFVFRTLFGLSLAFSGPTEPEQDSLQTYLIGLKYATTGQWPTYGPDQYLMTTGFHTQIPGALEGLAIGLPLKVFPTPEAPFLFLNLLSLSGIALLAFWIVRRLPSLSFYFIFAWIALLPWTLNQGTNVYNPCYLVFGSVLFTVGFLEAFPPLSTGWFGPGISFAMMGFGTFWNMQFHQSWVLFLPLVALAFFWRRRAGGKGSVQEIGSFIGGAGIPLAFLIPTFVQEGCPHAPSGIVQSFQFLNWDNMKAFFTILARYLSLASFEMPRFVGGGTVERMDFMRQVPWLWPPAVLLLVVGWVQPFLLLGWGLWKREEKTQEQRWVYGLTMGIFLMIWDCFWFTTTGPSAHMYFLFMPWLVVYSFYVWAGLKGAFWKGFGLACLAASLWFQTGFLIQKAKDPNSFWAFREKVAQALEKKDYRILAERRPGSYY